MRFITNKCKGECKSRKTEEYRVETVTLPGMVVPYVILHDADACRKDEDE